MDATVSSEPPAPTAVLQEHVWSVHLAASLVERFRDGHGTSVTWYNHASLRCAVDAGIDVGRFDFVGVDGTLLRRLTNPTMPRTSADLVLPLLLEQLPGCRVALVGSTRAALNAARAVIGALPSRPAVVMTCDGFDELPDPEELARDLRAARVDLVVLGLGAPLQDRYLRALVQHGLTRELLLTCGGWLDQVSRSGYYPEYAYRLKLNWLIRLLREPGRLWRRYTVEAVAAHRDRVRLRHHLLEVGAGPVAAMVGACGPGPADGAVDHGIVPPSTERAA